MERRPACPTPLNGGRPRSVAHASAGLLWAGLAVVAAGGCAGGWTGEITDLGPCVVDEGPTSLEPVVAALDAAGREGSVTLEWTDPDFSSDTATELRFVIAESGPAHRFGGEGCSQPVIRSEASGTVSTEDGALAEQMRGVVTVQEPGLVHVRLRRPAAEMNGRGTPLSPDGELRVDVTLGEAELHGTVTFDSLVEEERGEPLATF